MEEEKFPAVDADAMYFTREHATAINVIDENVRERSITRARYAQIESESPSLIIILNDSSVPFGCSACRVSHFRNGRLKLHSSNYETKCVEIT